LRDLIILILFVVLACAGIGYGSGVGGNGMAKGFAAIGMLSAVTLVIVILGIV
jgi:hypothetical protein